MNGDWYWVLPLLASFGGAAVLLLIAFGGYVWWQAFQTDRAAARRRKLRDEGKRVIAHAQHMRIASITSPTQVRVDLDLSTTNQHEGARQ